MSFLFLRNRGDQGEDMVVVVSEELSTTAFCTERVVVEQHLSESADDCQRMEPTTGAIGRSSPVFSLPRS